MESLIRKKLKEIERAESVKVLHAVESGSRAWGFASPDSDWDVRFIYVRPIAHYLRLDAPRDVIEWQLDDKLDINGWDFQKALRLLMKSNSTLFEWNNSPIVYKTTVAWQDVHEVIDRYFASKASLYHYLHTAQGNYREYLKGETVRLKKYFYVLRPILACLWILDQGTPPPMLFSDLVKAEADAVIRPYIEALLARKVQSGELADQPRIDALNRYIEDQLEALQGVIERISPDPDKRWDELNELFVSIVKEQEMSGPSR